MIGVPVKVLHEAEGHIVTIETTSGEVGLLLYILQRDLDFRAIQVYRGKLIEAEDNMNSQVCPFSFLNNFLLDIRTHFPSVLFFCKISSDGLSHGHLQGWQSGSA